MAWNNEQEIIKARMAQAEDIISLDVGGVTNGFKVRKSVLTSVPDSALEAMFSGRHNLPVINGNIFIDKDPTIFINVLNYLRNGQQMPNNFINRKE